MSDGSAAGVVDAEVLPHNRKASVDLAPLMEIDRGAFRLTRFFEFTPTGLNLLAKPPDDVFGDLAEFLRIIETGINWIVGDYINALESAMGERASQLIDASNLSPASIKVYRWCAAKVAPENRRHELSFEHHVAVASLDAEQQQHWLKKAIDGDDGIKWSSARLKREIKNVSGGTALGAATAEYEVTVTCESEAVSDALQRQLENLGYTKEQIHAKKPRQ